MAKFRGSDILIILRGLNSVSKAATAVTEAELKEAWTAMSFRPIVKNFVEKQKSEDLVKQAGEVFERSLTVARGLKEFSVIAAQQAFSQNQGSLKSSQDINNTMTDTSNLNGNFKRMCTA